MKVLIIGATGFIGKELVKELVSAGHIVAGISRDVQKAREILGPGPEILEWDGFSSGILAGYLPGADAVVNLAGESIAAGRWTAKRKLVITESRLATSRKLLEAIMLASFRPRVIIQGSAIGYYGSPVEDPADESHLSGSGFMANLTRDWESAILPAEKLIGRVVILRTGLVLGKDGGLLQKMLLPFRFGSGIILGSGRQWMSWIHIIDLVKAIRFLLENDICQGPFNMTAPNPVTMKDFIKTTGKVLGKPAWMKVPEVLIRAGLGRMGEETVLASQNIIPARLEKEGFNFTFSHLEPALTDLLIMK
jgi:uncharacterized protein (TIGR01777 family)